MTTTLFSLTVALVLSATPSSIDDEGRSPLHRYGEVQVEPGASIDVALPEPLTSADLDSWIAILDLAPDAALSLRAAVEEFYAARTPDIRQALEPVERAARDLARRSGLDLQRLPDAPEAFRDLVRLRNRAVSRFAAIEEDLFAQVAAAVSPESPETVADTIRQLRKRSRTTSTPPKLPMAAVDLRAIESALYKEKPLEILDRDAWMAARPSYDSELATLEERRIRLDLDMIVEDLAYFRDTNHDVRSLLEYRTQQSRRRLAVERSIIAANRRWADAFAQMMSPSDARRWLDAVRAATYPTLYPNPVDLRRLGEALETIGSSEAGVALGALREMIAGETARLASMETAVEAELVALAVSEARDVVLPAMRLKTEESLARLRRERCESAARVLEMCRAATAVRELPELSLLSSALQMHCNDDDPEKGDGTSPQTSASPAR
jgi:hypothetical protein